MLKSPEARTRITKELGEFAIRNNLFDNQGKTLLMQTRFSHYRKAILTELTFSVLELKRGNPKDIDLDMWKAYVKKAASLDVDAIVSGRVS